MTYSLKLNEAQMRVVSDALELYLRIRLGQIDVIVDPWMFAKRGDGLTQTAGLLDSARHALESVKHMLTGFSPTASWGIGAEGVPDVARVAADIRDVIRHHLAWERTPEGGPTVDYHEPMHWGGEPLPVVERHSIAKSTGASVSEGDAIVLVREAAAAAHDKCEEQPYPTREQLHLLFLRAVREGGPLREALDVLGERWALDVYSTAWASLSSASSELRLRDGRLEQAGNYSTIPWADVTQR